MAGRGFSRQAVWRLRKKAEHIELVEENGNVPDYNSEGEPDQPQQTNKRLRKAEGHVPLDSEDLEQEEWLSDAFQINSEENSLSKDENNDGQREMEMMRNDSGVNDNEVSASDMSSSEESDTSDNESDISCSSSSETTSSSATDIGMDATVSNEEEGNENGTDRSVSDNSDATDSDTSSGSEISDSDNDNDGDEQGDNAAQNDQDFNFPLYNGAPITLAESLVAIMTFALCHTLTGTCLADLLVLISLHCPPDSACKKSLYTFKKHFSDVGKNIIKYHYYCEECMTLLESKESNCLICAPKDISKGFFIEVPIKKQLQLLFKRNGFLQDLHYRFRRVKKSPDNIEDVYDGAIYKEHIQRGFLNDSKHISFMLYSDGVVKHKNSRISLWPVYLVINELSYRKRTQKQNIILSGLWFGKTKPHVNSFLDPLHKSMEEFYNEGYMFEVPDGPPIQVRGSLLCMTCDLPAKSMFLNFKQFNGYYGCANCFSPGEEYDLGNRNTVHVYPYTRNIEMRTDEKVEEYARLAVASGLPCFGVKGPTLLFYMMLSMVRSMGIDAMHGIFSGCGKLLLQLLFDKSNRGNPFSLYNVVGIVNERMKRIRPPSFLHRMPQSVDDLSHWKSLDYKVWLLYYSAPTLTDILPNQYFVHHLKSVSAVSLLMQQSISLHQIHRAKDLLHEYVEQFQRLFGLRYMTMNIHQLLHLPDVVLDLGPLWVYSCYFLEDLNGKLCKFVHGTRHAGIQFTSSATIYLNLSSMIGELNPQGSLRKFCEKLSHIGQQFKTTEEISPGDYSIGTYKLLRQVPPDLQHLLHTFLRVDRGTVQIFYRLMKKRVLYVSKEYKRVKLSNSSAVSFYSNDNESMLGIVQYFVRVSNCNCSRKCLCLPASFAAVILKYERVLWEVVHDEASVSLFHIFKAENTNTVVVTSVEKIKSLCFFLEVGTGSFIIEPINTLEAE